MQSDVIACPRCGGKHSGVEFLPFTAKNPIYSHWAMCETVREPILLKESHTSGGNKVSDAPLQ